MNTTAESVVQTLPGPIMTVLETLTIPTQSLEDLRLVDSSKGEIEVANAFEVNDNQMHELAGHSLAELKKTRAFIEAKRDKEAEPYVQVKRRAEAVRKSLFDFYELIILNYKSAEDILTRHCTKYIEDQRRIREEADRLARQEQQRIEREAQQREQKARDDAAEFERQAAAARAAGNTEQAAALQEQAHTTISEAEAEAAAVPLFAPPTAPIQEPPKLVGVGFVKKWKGRLAGITEAERQASKLKLIQFVSSNPQFINLLDVNEPALNKQADSLRGAMKIDGCEAYQDTHSRRQA